MMASSLVMFPAAGRRWYRPGRCLVAEQDNSKVQESFRCQSDGTDDGLQFHIL